MTHSFLATCLIALAVASFPASAKPSLSPIFSDHAVLQRHRPAPIWGTADAGEAITVTLGAARATATADAHGKWTAWLPALPVTTEPRELRASSTTGDVVLIDVVVGDVWLCAGQSNMGFALRDAQDARPDIDAADLPLIRAIGIAPHCKLEPSDTFDADQKSKWAPGTPKSVGGWSAVAFYFAREVHRKTGVPIGLIQIAWGGTPIEAWTPEALVQGRPEVQYYFDDLAKAKVKMAARPDEYPYNEGIMIQSKLGTIYNGMVHPVAPYGVRGFVWYQGEQNGGQGDDTYGRTLRSLITGWRTTFAAGRSRPDDLPFIVVQLPAFGGPYSNHWERTREAQALSAAQLPNAYLANTIDLGDKDDIHPKRKREVGDRAARLALAHVYKQYDVVPNGPTRRATNRSSDGALRVVFDHAAGLTTRDDAPPMAFEVAGPSGDFKPATASIDGQAVVLRAADVPAPTRARYAWRSYVEVNLVNAEGLPAYPFEDK